MPVTILRHLDERHKSSGHLYMVRLDGKDETQRNRLIELMAQKGVATNVHYKPLPMLTAYKNLGFDVKNFPNAYEMYKNEVTLPLHTLLSDDDVDYVVSVFESCLKEL